MTDTTCLRCARPLTLAPRPGSAAHLLKRAKKAQGLCINCATHDWLRNTYPPNMLLAQCGPHVLLVPHVQAQFAAIMQAGQADADPAEIDWQAVVDNWDLPFPKPVRRSATNPMDEADLGRERERKPPPPRQGSLFDTPMMITRFEQLNEIEPGLGDEIRGLLRRAFGS